MFSSEVLMLFSDPREGENFQILAHCFENAVKDTSRSPQDIAHNIEMEFLMMMARGCIRSMGENSLHHNLTKGGTKSIHASQRFVRAAAKVAVDNSLNPELPESAVKHRIIESVLLEIAREYAGMELK